jgi:hypothetical protein
MVVEEGSEMYTLLVHINTNGGVGFPKKYPDFSIIVAKEIIKV